VRTARDFRRLGWAVLGALVLAGALALLPRLGSLSNPEAELITQLKRTERDGLTLPLGPGLPSLVSSRHHFDRITVTLDLPARQAKAVSTLDLDGRVGQTEVSTLGLERTPFREVDGRWAPTDGWAPLLRDALSLLERRRRALEQDGDAALEALVVSKDRARALGDPRLAALRQVGHRRYRVTAWYLRTERSRVRVTEAYRLEGDTPDRPVDEEGRRSLVLVREGDVLLFEGALM
jgi:hypothetical protein